MREAVREVRECWGGREQGREGAGKVWVVCRAGQGGGLLAAVAGTRECGVLIGE